MKSIPLFPDIRITLEDGCYTLDNGINRFVVSDEQNVLLGDGVESNGLLTNWIKSCLEFDDLTDMTIQADHPLYLLCNRLLLDDYETFYVIYDPENDRWFCYEEPDGWWTTDLFDEDILYVESHEEAKPFLTSPNYTVRIRCFYKDDEDDDGDDESVS